ncbi:MAG: hypothetical protein ABIJ56_19750 [Pseudomonadota bacterium]
MQPIITKYFLFAIAALFLSAACDSGSGPECGDGVKEGDEVCDGMDFGDDNCQKRGYRGGLLRCIDTCDAIFTNNCTGGCGNGYKEPDEECDGSDFGGDNCELHDFDYGNLSCGSDCKVSTGECKSANCGDGEVEPVEQCEADVEWTETCEHFGYNTGELACTDCEWDFSDCATWECGNGTIDPGEDCDFDSEGVALLNDQTCETIGYDLGELSCNPADYEDIAKRCKFNIGDCSEYECGNGELEGDEECEEGVAIEDACTDHDFGGGEIGCDAERCLFDFSDCTDGCGNGAMEGEEQCDGDDVGGEDCASISDGAYTGELRCKTDCTYDLSLCVEA